MSINKNERERIEFSGENIQQTHRKRYKRKPLQNWKLQHGGLLVNWPTFYRWKKKI